MADTSQGIFRRKTLDRISSPEQLDDYLHVTTPAVWAVLAAVVLLLAGLLVWSCVTSMESYATGVAQVEDGVLTISFTDEAKARYVEPGMNVTVGDLVTPILSVGEGDDGFTVAIASAGLPDGRYGVKVGYKQTQIIDMLFPEAVDQ